MTKILKFPRDVMHIIIPWLPLDHFRIHFKSATKVQIEFIESHFNRIHSLLVPFTGINIPIFEPFILLHYDHLIPDSSKKIRGATKGNTLSRLTRTKIIQWDWWHAFVRVAREKRGKETR